MKSFTAIRILTITLSALIAVSAIASPEKISVPREVEVGGFTKYVYWFAKKQVVDVDKVLEKLGMRAHYCTFRQSSPLQDFSYKGVGRCLYQHFTTSVKTNDSPGQTYAWIKDPKTGQYYAVEIQWRPPQGGWMKLIKQYFAMRFERAAKNASDPLPYQEFIGGDLKIILPEYPASVNAIAANAPQWLQEKLATANTVSFHLEPVGRNEAKVVYNGSIKIVQRPNETGEVLTHVQRIETDINVVILKRHFFVTGKYRPPQNLPSLADQAELPVLSIPERMPQFPEPEEVMK